MVNAMDVEAVMARVGSELSGALQDLGLHVGGLLEK